MNSCQSCSLTRMRSRGSWRCQKTYWNMWREGTPRCKEHTSSWPFAAGTRLRPDVRFLTTRRWTRSSLRERPLSQIFFAILAMAMRANFTALRASPSTTPAKCFKEGQTRRGDGSRRPCSHGQRRNQPQLLLGRPAGRLNCQAVQHRGDVPRERRAIGPRRQVAVLHGPLEPLP